MINGYLCPLSEDLIEFKSNLSRGTLGSNITLYNSEKTDYSSIDIAIVGLNEYRNSDEISDESLNLENLLMSNLSFLKLFCQVLFPSTITKKSTYLSKIFNLKSNKRSSSQYEKQS